VHFQFPFALKPKKAVQRPEPMPVIKAAARLIQHIFLEAVSLPEFQRQIAAPNVPKYSASIIQLGEKMGNEALNVKMIAYNNNDQS
jgi:hypothetical protein